MNYSVKNVIAVIVTYNRSNLLDECISSLLRQKSTANLKILIVDNKSTDNTLEIVQKYQKSNKVEYVNTGKNLGGAGGFEFGIRYVATRDFDYIWIMDDDCIPHENALSEFISFAEKNRDNLGFLSSKAIWTDGNACVMNQQRKSFFKKVAIVDDQPQEIVIATFVSMFVPKNVVLDVGVPLGELFIWGDDWEYSRRISRNYKCYVIPKSVVVHKTIHNYGGNIASDDVARISRYYYGYRNGIYISKKENITVKFYYIMKYTKDILMVLFQAKSSKWERIKMIIKGSIAGISFEPDIKKYKISCGE